MQNQQIIWNDVCQPNQVVGYWWKNPYHLGLWNCIPQKCFQTTCCLQNAWPARLTLFSKYLNNTSQCTSSHFYKMNRQHLLPIKTGHLELCFSIRSLHFIKWGLAGAFYSDKGSPFHKGARMGYKPGRFCLAKCLASTPKFQGLQKENRKPGARYWPTPISSALQLWVYYSRFLLLLPVPNYLVETHRNPKTSHSPCNSAAFRAKELESGVSIAFQRVFRLALTKMDIEGHRSTVAPCPDIASLQTGKSDLRSPWLPRNKIAGKQNCTMSLWPRFVAEFGHLASQSIKIKHWLLWKLTLQSDLIIKAITKNWRLVWWDLLLRFLFAALHQTNKVVEKDPSKNWFKLPGKPVGKWEIELYRKQTAWDSDSNLHVPKAH